MICATICEATCERAIRVARGLAPPVDLVEVRLDSLTEADPAALVAGIALPVVFTCRAPADGGSFGGSEAERLALLRRGIDAGAAWIDIEDHAVEALGDRGDSRLIVSHHDFGGMPDDPEALVARMASHAPDIVKLVPTAKRPADLLTLFRLIRENEKLAAHALGPATLASRVLGALNGSAIVYGAALPGAEGAPGQPTVRYLMDAMRVGEPVSWVVLLFGGNLDHSVSPAMLNGYFRMEGLRAVSVPWPVEDAADIPTIVRETDAVGAAVTIPLKEAVAPHLDDLDESARRIGSVNTILVRNGRLVGRNTDLAGAVAAIREGLPDLREKRALVVGAGGAARAIAHGLADEGARVFVMNRTRDRAAVLAAEVGGEVDAGGEVDLVVNATPVGQWPKVEESPLPAERLSGRPVVFDAVYNPMATRLLRDAGERGCKTVLGLTMLAAQAVEQGKLWFRDAPDFMTLLLAGVRELGRRFAPVVLIGLRGTGKSTVGKLLSIRLGRSFTDLDDEIEAMAGKSVSRIFAEDGEERFREMEREALEQALDRVGHVVAAGGGIVAVPQGTPEGFPRNARTVLLTASVEAMVERIRGSDRPALTGHPLEEEIRHLKGQRGEAQREAADVVVDTTNLDPDEVVIELLNSL